MPLIRLDPRDTVAIATSKIAMGEAHEGVTALEEIPSGHKISLKSFEAGEAIIKYAQVIGYAKEGIPKGAHLHTHNIAFRNVSGQYAFGTNLLNVEAPQKAEHFMGFDRGEGRYGTRNFIAILTSVNCSATAARKIAAYFTPDILSDYPNVDGVAAFVHGTGCGMQGNGEGFDALQRVMWGYARHPNCAAVLMVGLGCEINQIDWLLEAYGLKTSALFQTMNIQSVAGLSKTIERGVEKIKAMLPLVNEFRRTACPLSGLTLALQCGGSDAWSGVTANPALGYACDMLISRGGRGVLAETPEIYGAEHLLTARAISKPVGESLLARIEWWEDYTKRNAGNMDNNPSPGNKAGGLTTILEKSLGAVAKGGTTPLMAVYKYAEKITASGLSFMDTPGYDPVSVTGQIAGGCNIVCFTTGRGSAFGSKPTPTLKIATNTDIARRMPDEMDINAGEILSNGASLEEKGQEIFETILRVASGEKTKSEAQDLGDYEFVPWQIGATM